MRRTTVQKLFRYSSLSHRCYSQLNGKPRILVTGALGQIGAELIPELRKRYGSDSVLSADIRKLQKTEDRTNYIFGNVLDKDDIEKIIVEKDIDWIIHNVSILSAAGERDPQKAISINIDGFNNMLELARKHNLRIFAPSSIAAFGPTTPRDNTPDLTIMRPTTIYGVTKVHLELLGEYYCAKYGVDFRSVRYPGIISYVALPGGGTTDYAVDIFYKAIQDGSYKCFLSKDSELPMMYMPDCVEGTIKLLEAPSEKLTQRTYNLAAVSFTPVQLANEIKKLIPKFEITYEPDFRQKIADSWPRSLDDSKARQDWGWSHKYDLSAMVQDMITRLKEKLGKTKS